MKLLLVYVSILLTLSSAGQYAGNKRFPTSQPDTVVVRKLLDSAVALRFVDTVKHTAVTQQALRIAEQIGSKVQIAQALRESTVHLKINQRFAPLQRGLAIATEINDTTQIIAYNNALGYAYSLTDKEPRALDHFFTNLRILEKRPNPRDLNFVYSSLGSIYGALDDPKGIEYMEKALAYRSMYQDSSRMVTMLINIGASYYGLRQPERAIKITEAAARWAMKSPGNVHWLVTAQENLCRFYLDLTPEQTKALGMNPGTLLERVRQLATENMSKINQVRGEIGAGPCYTLGRVELLAGNYQKASTYFHKALHYVSEQEQHNIKWALYLQLSRVHEATGTYDSAYLYHKAYNAWKDSVSQQEIKKEVSKKLIEFEFSKIQDSLQLMQRVTAEQLRKEQLIALQAQQEIILKQTLLDLAAQEKRSSLLAIDKANTDLRIQQALLREKEKALTISRQEKELSNSMLALKQSQLTLANQELEAQRKQKIFYIAGACTLLLVAYLMFRSYRNRQRAKAQILAERQKAQRAEVTRKMAEFEMHGLRAQLNPHFMFNSLNAIQEQILREKNDVAEEYLSTFAKMLRQLLENAEYSFVTLGKELEFLQLYLSMEQLRMPDLEYSLFVDPAVDASTVMIPNMILQPYLENSIWHGLSPKTGNRAIRLAVHHSGESFRVVIEDNGIGRSRAAELKSKYRKSHKSKGMELLHKRFELMKVEFGSIIQVNITDLEQNGVAAGTRVELDIPYSLSAPMRMGREAIINN